MTPLPASSGDLIADRRADYAEMGALERITGIAASALTSGSMFAFTVERHDGPDDYLLRESRRYAHSQAYVKRLIAASGLELVSLEASMIRMDRGQPVKGLIVVTRNSGFA